jgi:hypothetical protein
LSLSEELSEDAEEPALPALEVPPAAPAAELIAQAGAAIPSSRPTTIH